MTRELAPWEGAFDSSLRLQQVGPLTGMAMVALAAGLHELAPPQPRKPAQRVLRTKPEQPSAKRVRQAQRAARKARRRGEGS